MSNETLYSFISTTLVYFLYQMIRSSCTPLLNWLIWWWNWVYIVLAKSTYYVYVHENTNILLLLSIHGGRKRTINGWVGGVMFTPLRQFQYYSQIQKWISQVISVKTIFTVSWQVAVLEIRLPSFWKRNTMFSPVWTIIQQFLFHSINISDPTLSPPLNSLV